jgi:hypothetical protein
MRVSEQLITKLTELKESNSEATYTHILNILKNQIIPVPLATSKPFKLIRYRKHDSSNKDKFFINSEELTYRKDIVDIKNFGRANEPGQGFFYCNDNNNQNTGIAEIFSVFRGNETCVEEVLTISAWNLKETLNLAVILPTEKNKGKNAELDKMVVDVKKFYKQFENNPEFIDVKILNEFLANQFALDIELHNSNYKITSAFSNYIKEKFPVDGIIYSSIKSEHQGINVVLWPEVVDQKLEFAAARKSTFKLTKEKTFVEQDITESKGYDKINDIISW